MTGNVIDCLFLLLLYYLYLNQLTLTAVIFNTVCLHG